MLNAGAELVSFYAPENELARTFALTYPQTRQVDCVEAILEDPSIQLIVSASVNCERAPLGIRVMEYGKDFMSAKPGFTTLEQLAEARRIQAQTGKIYSVYFSERLAVRAAIKAGELVQNGAIGTVLQTIGLGPHHANLSTRPAWFFQKQKYGGILTDIGSHQCEQFLFYTGSTRAGIVAAQVGNLNHPQSPEFEDFGDVLLRGNGGMGYFRVDWFTPQGLGTWGDGRLVILGTDGYIELRKYVDLAGRPGEDHLFLVNRRGTEYMNCSEVELPYGKQLLVDIVNRSETAMSQEHVFLASELALLAQQKATYITF